MTIHIPAEVEEMARCIAATTGKTPDAVVKEAVEAHAKTLGLDLSGRSRGPRRAFNEAKVRAIIERVAALPILDDRTDDEILGYNAQGVWD